MRDKSEIMRLPSKLVSVLGGVADPEAVQNTAAKTMAAAAKMFFCFGAENTGLSLG